MDKYSWFVAWFSCVLCVFYTLQNANIYARKDPWVFVGLAIFAVQWGVLIVFYTSRYPASFDEAAQLADLTRILGPGINQATLHEMQEYLDHERKHLPEFLPAIAGYLCALGSCTIYRRMASAQDQDKKRLSRRECLAAYLLLTVAIPHVFDFPFKKLWHGNIGHEELEVFLTSLLKCCGFYSMYRVTRIAVCSSFVKRSSYVLLIVYILLECTYTVNWVYIKHFANGKGIAMNTYYLWAFALAKIFLTILFVHTVLMHCKPDHGKPYREKSVSQRLLGLIHIP